MNEMERPGIIFSKQFCVCCKFWVNFINNKQKIYLFIFILFFYIIKNLISDRSGYIFIKL